MERYRTLRCLLGNLDRRPLLAHFSTSHIEDGVLHGYDGGANETGTMDGVRTLAAYADTSKYGQLRFVISTKSNGPMCA